ncbi:MAG: PEP-CTERM sorting domain-containing protein [Nitrospirota bacterium]
MRKMILLLAIALAIVPCTAWAALTTLTFDEAPFQPADGLTVQGVTFGFQSANPSPSANYNVPVPFPLTYIQNAALVGDGDGVLTLDFAANPTPTLRFGVAQTSLEALTPGFSVILFDPNLLELSTIDVNTSPLLSFSEGLFDYSGALVGFAAIRFAIGEQGEFALDNLTYGTPDNVVPEPSTFLLLGAGIAGVIVMRRKLKVN